MLTGIVLWRDVHYLPFGTVVCDMHSGLRLPRNWRIVNSFQLSTEVGTEFIRDTIRAIHGPDSDYIYTNKELVVIGEGTVKTEKMNPAWSFSETEQSCLKLAYSYDGRYIQFYDVVIEGDE